MGAALAGGVKEVAEAGADQDWILMNNKQPVVGVIMGSKSDWETMRHASQLLDLLEIAHESRVVSAHRTPARMSSYAMEAAGRGLKVIIAGAGGAAHLPGMVAAQTWLPVLGVPVQSKALNGVDSLLSIVQMPAGIPVGTLAIGHAGARNAALLAASILGLEDARIRAALEAFVRFAREISVIVARGANRQTEVFPVCENVHANHILDLTIVPAQRAIKARRALHGSQIPDLAPGGESAGSG